MAQGDVIKGRGVLKQLQEDLLVTIQDKSKKEQELIVVSAKLQVVSEALAMRENDLGKANELLTTKTGESVNTQKKIEEYNKILNDSFDICSGIKERERLAFDSLSTIEQEKTTVENLIKKMQLDALSALEKKDEVEKNLKDVYEELFRRISETSVEENRLIEIKSEYNDILEKIEIAMSQFNIFEMRIKQFSDDTGYIVGYEPPKRLTIVE